MGFRQIIIFILASVIHLSLAGQKTIEAGFLKTPPVMDGIISAGEWPVADSASGFIQMEPQKGMPATEATTAYIGYDNDNIYVAVINYYTDPGDIVARMQQRDELTKNDDLVSVIFDTYHDKNAPGCGLK